MFAHCHEVINAFLIICWAGTMTQVFNELSLTGPGKTYLHSHHVAGFMRYSEQILTIALLYKKWIRNV